MISVQHDRGAARPACDRFRPLENPAETVGQDLPKPDA